MDDYSADFYPLPNSHIGYLFGYLTVFKYRKKPHDVMVTLYTAVYFLNSSHVYKRPWPEY